MENETIVEKQVSDAEIELQTKKEKNIKLYPFYRIFSWDLLFYYAIIYLFLTTEKGITAAQVLEFDAFYLLSKVIMQIPCTLFIQKFGKRKSLIIANFIGIVHILLIIFAQDFTMLLFSQLLCAFTFTTRAICDTDMLYDSLEHNEKRGHNFAKIDGKAMSKYYYVDAITAIISSFLFVINPYVPMTFCFISLCVTFVLSIKFEEIHSEKGKIQVIEELKNIRYGFRDILKSSRLRSLLIFNAFFVGLIGIIRNIRNTVLVEIGVPEQYFGIIFALMGIVLGISTRFQGRIHNKFRNKTLSFLSMPTAISCIVIGFVMFANLDMETSASLIILMLLIQCIMRGPYYVLIKRYFNNFTNSDKRVKIAGANVICENVIASVLIYIAAFILDNIAADFTITIIGCVATILFVLLLDHMRKTVGLKPEQYVKKENK